MRPDRNPDPSYIRSPMCVVCGELVFTLRDKQSYEEYVLTGQCQDCQDDLHHIDAETEAYDEETN
jgi:hypothetical protein